MVIFVLSEFKNSGFELSFEFLDYDEDSDMYYRLTMEHYNSVSKPVFDSIISVLKHNYISVTLTAFDGRKEFDIPLGRDDYYLRMKVSIPHPGYKLYEFSSDNFGTLTSGLEAIMAMLYDADCDVEYYAGKLIGIGSIGRRKDRPYNTLDPLESIIIHPENFKKKRGPVFRAGPLCLVDPHLRCSSHPILA